MLQAIIKRDHASDKMESINPIIQEAVEKALEKLNTGLSYIDAELRNGTKANLLYDIIKSGIKVGLAEFKDIKIKEKWGSITLVIDNKLNAKIKKINNITGLPTFSKTSATKAFLDQSQLSLFPDVPAPTNICIGFKINDIYTQLLELKVLCINKNQMAWEPIDMKAEQTISNEAFIADETTVKPRVTKKQKKAQ